MTSAHTEPLLDYAGASQPLAPARPSDQLHRVLGHLVALGLGATFVYAAVSKIIDPAGFVANLRNYRLFPWWSLNFAALVVPWWELIVGVAILFAQWRRPSALLTLGMGVIFLACVSQALYRGLDISCGCFGHAEDAARVGLQTLAIDTGIILGSVYLLRTGTAPRTIDPPHLESVAAPS
ncbi:MAG: MauE/DoxX family redox-associated membrane protein [Phycisphaerae bacterium]